MSSGEELRAQLAPRLEEAHPADRERFSDDRYLSKFLEHHDGDLKLALQMAQDALQWRKTSGVNDIDETTVNMDYIKEGLFYPRGKDVDGCAMLIFKAKKNAKGQRDSEDIKRCTLYWIERLDRLEGHDRISVFFDMESCGLSNMDMDFTRFLIGLFKSYYPDFLNYILIYEMPMLLSAAFKIIKGLLPAKAVAKMKFINKSSLTQYVPADQAATCWGGEDDYEFAFVPYDKSQNDASSAKRVTFADPGTPSADEDRRMMKLTPRDVIPFRRESDGTVVGGFAITNAHDAPISYKIKTTALGKTKVQPNVGSLRPGATEQVRIALTLGGGQQQLAARVKFLVMCTPLPAARAEPLAPHELVDVWKNADGLRVEQQRLQCAPPPPEKTRPSDDDGGGGAREAAGDSSAAALDARLRSIHTLQLVNATMTALLACLVLYLIVAADGRARSATTDGDFCPGP